MNDDIFNDIDINDLLDDVEQIQDEIDVDEDIERPHEDLILKNKKGGHTMTEKIDKSIERSLYSRKNKDLIDGLTKAQLLGIEMICKGMTKSQIAKQLGVTRKTVYDWEKSPKFQEMLKKTQKDYMSAFSQYLMSEVPNAVKTLVSIMKNEDAKNSDRITASKNILEYANIKKGGIKDENGNGNNYETVVSISINQAPPPPKAEEVIKDVKVEDIIDADFEDK